MTNGIRGKSIKSRRIISGVKNRLLLRFFVMSNKNIPIGTNIAGSFVRTKSEPVTT
jgi:hypothetical protein